MYIKLFLSRRKSGSIRRKTKTSVKTNFYSRNIYIEILTMSIVNLCRRPDRTRLHTLAHLLVARLWKLKSWKRGSLFLKLYISTDGMYQSNSSARFIHCKNACGRHFSCRFHFQLRDVELESLHQIRTLYESSTSCVSISLLQSRCALVHLDFCSCTPWS